MCIHTLPCLTHSNDSNRMPDAIHTGIVDREWAAGSVHSIVDGFQGRKETLGLPSFLSHYFFHLVSPAKKTVTLHHIYVISCIYTMYIHVHTAGSC